jgi:hypothetical protein
MGLRPFQKDTSGNPGGRPKGYFEFAQAARGASMAVITTR